MKKRIKHKIVKGDTVVITKGRDKGKVAKVMQVLLSDSGVKLLIEGCNFVTKHKKPTQQTPGSIVKEERPLDISNVAFYDHEEGVGTRIGYKFIDGKKCRFSKLTGKIINV